jgi:DNA replication protein DnaC
VQFVVLPVGVGKSHLINALVVEALKRGYTAWQRPIHRVLADLQAARADGTHRRRFHRLANVDVLALDDFGLRPLLPEMAEDLYELIRERYERKAVILTSNHALAEWPDAFGNPVTGRRRTRPTDASLPHPGYPRRSLSPTRPTKGGLSCARTLPRTPFVA